MTPKQRKWIAVGIALVAASIAWEAPKGYRWWHLRRMAKASDEVRRLTNDYRKCMIGDPKNGDELEQLQHIEEAFAQAPDGDWPQRCVRYAEQIHAQLVDSGLVDKDRDFAMLDLMATRAMKLPPPMVPGQPFAAGRYVLMLGSGPSHDGIPPAPPPAPAVHLEVEDALAASAVVPFDDPAPAKTLRLAWMHGGLNVHCAMVPLGTAPFFSAQCGDIAGPAWLGNVTGGVVATDDGPADVFLVNDEHEEEGVVSAKTGARLWSGVTHASFVFDDASLAAVVPAGKDGKARELVRARAGKAIDRTAVAPNATMAGRMLLWTEATKGAPPHLFVREVTAKGALPPAQDLGVVAPEIDEWRVCQSSDHLFLFGARQISRGKIGDADVITSKMAVSIADAKLAFAPPIEGDLQWPARSPRWSDVVTTSCHEGSIAFASIAGAAVRETVCGATGCVQRTSKPFVDEPDDSRVAAVDLHGKMLFARVLDTRGPFHARVTTVRIRLAPVEALDTTPDVVVLGATGGWGWDEHFRPLGLELYARQAAAFVLVRTSDNAMGLGIDPNGAFGLVRDHAD